MVPSPHDVTQILRAWSDGDRGALDELIPIVYEELRRQAARYLRRERPDHTLQTTALIHEAYVRLVDQKEVRWQNRAHFFGVAAQMMRRILVDHARKDQALKRGGPAAELPLEETAAVSGVPDMNLVALDEALTRLAAMDERKGRVVELKYFGGLTAEEAAEVLGVSEATVRHDWGLAKAWLRREIAGGDSG
jgi:RNA polymerase sigma factor (TIGR02999 family)